jgi:DNA-binding NtrC family response regulator
MNYLPDNRNEIYPAIRNTTSSESSGNFASEREMLYQLLFEMRNELNNVKQTVTSMMQGGINGLQGDPSQSFNHFENQPTINVSAPQNQNLQKINQPVVIQSLAPKPIESLNLTLMEKEMIEKALIKYKGRRRNAAAELGISERTLYRKLKDYDLEHL